MKCCLDFLEVSLNDIEKIYAFTSKYGENSCQHSPVSMYSLFEKYGDRTGVFPITKDDLEEVVSFAYRWLRENAESHDEEALNREMDCIRKQILASVKEDIDTFVEGADQFDDITMMTVSWRGESS